MLCWGYALFVGLNFRKGADKGCILTNKYNQNIYMVCLLKQATTTQV